MTLISAMAGIMSALVALFCAVGFLICTYLLILEVPWLLVFAPSFAIWGWRKHQSNKRKRQGTATFFAPLWTSLDEDVME